MNVVDSIVEKIQQFCLNQWETRRNRSVALILFVLVLVFMERGVGVPAGKSLGGADIRGLFLPWLEYVQHSIQQGSLPFWAPDQFAGYPFLSNPQVALFYPPTWIMILLPVNQGVSWHLIFHMWLAGFGMYLFARAMGARTTGALLAAVTFTFNGYVAARILAGHVGLVATNSWLPWMLLATLWSVKRRHFAAGLLAGLPFGMAILAGHTTSLLYLGLGWIAFALYLIVQEGKAGLVLRQLLLAGISGLLISSVQLLPLLQFSQLSGRTSGSYDFAAGFSLPPTHLLTLLVPEFFGEPTRVGYWSVPNFEELTYYVGLLPLLAILLAARRPSRKSMFYITFGVVALLLAFGSYGFLHRIIYDLVPPFRLARAPGRAAYLFVFAASTLLGIVATEWGRSERLHNAAQLRPLLRWILGGGGALILIAHVMSSVTFSIQHPSDNSGRLWHHLGSWTTAGLLLAIGCWLLWHYLASSSVSMTQRRPVAVGLVAFVLVDLWLFGFKFTQLHDTAPHPMWQETATLIGESDFRVLPWGVSIFEQNGAWQAGLHTVFSYNALEVASHVALTERVPDPRAAAYDLLGAGFVVSSGPLDQYGDGDRPLTLISNNGSAWVYQRTDPLPIVRLVTEYELIADQWATIDRIYDGTFNPVQTVLVDEAPNCDVTGGEAGQVAVTQRDAGRWGFTVQSDVATLLVISETDYPGWEASINGSKVPILTAYGSLKAICVPAGEQEVVLAYRPVIFWYGGALSALAVILLLGSAWLLRRHV